LIQPFSPKVNDVVEAIDSYRHTWRLATVDKVPDPTKGIAFYHLTPVDDSRQTMVCNIGELRPQQSEPALSVPVDVSGLERAKEMVASLIEETETRWMAMLDRVAARTAEVNAPFRARVVGPVGCSIGGHVMSTDGRSSHLRGVHFDELHVDDPDGPHAARPTSPPAGRLATVLRDLLPEGVKLDPETPGRMFAALADMLDGYDEQVDLKTFPLPRDTDPGVVLVRDIPFASLCEHHVLPFSGRVSVAYLPGPKLVGLSKIPRLVRTISRRLQTQERLGQEIADTLGLGVDARGVMVVITSQHSCMCHRGIESPGQMQTSCVRGVFRHNDAARAEVLQLLAMK
jgi:GTP cyclohydrolase I